MSHHFSLDGAGQWLLHSGIQEPIGGFARYYDAETGKNRPVSTEISGYAASALIYLFHLTGDEEYLDAAKRTAQFLAETWDARAQAFPFEWPSPSMECEHLTYFFDSGIIVRGLLAVWREVGDPQLLEVASAAARGMVEGFRSAAADYHPILALPDKAPLPRSAKWSRAPGCYQLKAAMAWWDVAEITSDARLREAYLEMVESAIATNASFLCESKGLYETMDRLHAYAYFLEGLLPVIEQPACRAVYEEGLARMEQSIGEIEDTFLRSDVLAQWLRARHFLGINDGGDDRRRCRLAEFQDPSGGFWFGRRDGKISPQLNPVSTVFALQALQMETDDRLPCARTLI